MDVEKLEFIRNFLALGALLGLPIVCVVAYIASNLRKRFGPFATIMILAGLALVGWRAFPTSGEKRPDFGSITFLNPDVEVQYIFNNGSYLTNDLCHIAYSFIIAPSNADVNVVYRPHVQNPGEWQNAFTGTLGAQSVLEFSFAGAHTNDWYVYTTWTPGANVQTNTVWSQEWLASPQASALIPKRCAVYCDGVFWSEYPNSNPTTPRQTFLPINNP